MQNNRLRILISKKLPKIKKTFFEWSQDVNCECFPKIFEEGSTIVNKLIWTFLFLIFSGLTCYLLAQNLLEYFR